MFRNQKQSRSTCIRSCSREQDITNDLVAANAQSRGARQLETEVVIRIGDLVEIQVGERVYEVVVGSSVESILPIVGELKSYFLPIPDEHVSIYADTCNSLAADGIDVYCYAAWLFLRKKKEIDLKALKATV